MTTEFEEQKAKNVACLLKQPSESFVRGARWEFNKNKARDAKIKGLLDEASFAVSRAKQRSVTNPSAFVAIEAAEVFINNSKSLLGGELEK